MSLSYLRSLLITDPLVILMTIVVGTADLFCLLFDKTGNASHKCAQIWSRILLFIGGVRVRVQGVENVKKDGSYVFASNHLSLADTPLVLAYVPCQFRFLAKVSLFNIPFIGFHLRWGRHIPVPRGDARASVKSMADAARTIRDQKISILIFPEGGRSEGELQPFKEGAALLAIRAGVPVVPVAIVGTRKVLPMGSVHIRAGKVDIRIGKPIPTADLDGRQRKDLTQELYRRVAELLGDDCKPASETVSV